MIDYNLSYSDKMYLLDALQSDITERESYGRPTLANKGEISALNRIIMKIKQNHYDFTFYEGILIDCSLYNMASVSPTPPNLQEMQKIVRQITKIEQSVPDNIIPFKPRS